LHIPKTGAKFPPVDIEGRQEVMMKRSITAGFLVLAVAVFSSCAERTTRLQPVPMAAVEKADPSAKDAQFEGTIDKVDAENSLITVQHWPLSKTFQVPSGCEIDILTNANAVLTQLKVGDVVAVTYSEAGKGLVAARIVRQGKAEHEEQNEKLERLEKMLNPSPNE
jgi:Cu/Ag efflux protein CusF